MMMMMTIVIMVMMMIMMIMFMMMIIYLLSNRENIVTDCVALLFWSHSFCPHIGTLIMMMMLMRTIIIHLMTFQTMMMMIKQILPMKADLPNQPQIVEPDHLVCLIRHLVDVSEQIVIVISIAIVITVIMITDIIIAIVIMITNIIIAIVICYLPFNSIITAIRPVRVASDMTCEDVLDCTNEA